MKTAISVPDAVFAKVETAAQRAGMSRSEFFAVAADRLADELDRRHLTARIDAAIAAVGEDEETALVTRAASRAIRSSTRDEEW